MKSLNSPNIRGFTSLAFLGLILAFGLLTTATPASSRFLSPDTWDPWMQDVDINRYAYSNNDPINMSDPDGHSAKSKAIKEIVKGSLETLGRILVHDAIETARRQAVKEAWMHERALIKKGLQGTVDWTEKQKEKLLKTGRVKGYDGHHINSVNDAAGLARDPDNIKLLSNAEHKKLHAENGGTKAPTKGPLLDRSKAYKNMLAEERALFDKQQEYLDAVQFAEDHPVIGNALNIIEGVGSLDPTDPGNWIGGAQ